MHFHQSYDGIHALTCKACMPFLLSDRWACSIDTTFCCKELYKGLQTGLTNYQYTSTAFPRISKKSNPRQASTETGRSCCTTHENTSQSYQTVRSIIRDLFIQFTTKDSSVTPKAVVMSTCYTNGGETRGFAPGGGFAKTERN